MNEPSQHDSQKPMSSWQTGMYTIVSLLLLYVALYLLVPMLPNTWRVPGSHPWYPNYVHGYEDLNRDIYWMPDYHGIPDQFFAPLYYLDRSYLRKEKWFFDHDYS